MSTQNPNGKNPNRIVASGGWSKGANKQRPVAPTPVPTPPPQGFTGFMQKARSVVDSYVSRGITQDKRIDDETKKVRLVSCHGDPSLGIEPCPFRRESTVEVGRYYCGECGCGDRQATWLNAKTPEDYTKLDFPRVVCPLNMPGFTNYAESSAETVERRMKYDFSRKEKIERTVQLTIKKTDEQNT